MTVLAPAIPYLLAGATIMQTVGGFQQASAAKQAGVDADNAAQFKARQMKVKAGQERASAQRAALEKDRQTKIIASNFKGQAAGMGASATDPSLVDNLADILTEGQYRSDTEIYQGEDAATSLESGAAIEEWEGKSARRAGKAKASALRLGATANLLSDGASLYDKYAPKKEA